MSLNCHECGKKIEGKPNFCPACGNKLEKKDIVIKGNFRKIETEENTLKNFRPVRN